MRDLVTTEEVHALVAYCVRQLSETRIDAPVHKKSLNHAINFGQPRLRQALHFAVFVETGRMDADDRSDRNAPHGRAEKRINAGGMALPFRTAQSCFHGAAGLKQALARSIFLVKH